ncbi:hypothetical protein EDB85DRAFT_2160040 [Lactarius pseudohatsudake]|nr:hypothetical protein EDB85DRAFT_2160040 [Lactarius pseudohatsudake]
MHKKGFVKKHFPDEWFAALIALERSAPVLSLLLPLCLLPVPQPLASSHPPVPPPSSLVTSSSRARPSHPTTPSSVGRRSQLSPRRASFKSPHPRPRAQLGPVDSPQEPGPAGKAGPQAKRRRDPSPSRRSGKRSKVGEGASGTSADSGAGGSMRPPSPRPAFMSLVQPDTASQPPPSSEPALPKTSRAKQDNTTSRAKAPSTRAAKGKGKGNPATTTDGDDDDPGCKSPIWGAQVPRLATSSFGDSSEPTPPQTMRSKQTTPRHAPRLRRHAAVQVAFGVLCFGPGYKSPGSGTQDPAGKAASSSEGSGCDDESVESHSHLQALQRDELVLWVEKHKIESTGKRPTRRDLIDVIAGAPKSEQPSKEDIESIVKERKSKRIMKAA